MGEGRLEHKPTLTESGGVGMDWGGVELGHNVAKCGDCGEELREREFAETEAREIGATSAVSATFSAFFALCVAARA